MRWSPCFPGYIGEFEIVDDHRSGKIVVQLNGRLNKTGVISPRYNVQVNQIENWVNLLLPARGFGIIILVGRLLETFSVKCANLTTSDNLLGYLGPRRGSTKERWRQTAWIRVLDSVFCTDVALKKIALPNNRQPFLTCAATSPPAASSSKSTRIRPRHLLTTTLVLTFRDTLT